MFELVIDCAHNAINGPRSTGSLGEPRGTAEAAIFGHGDGEGISEAGPNVSSLAALPAERLTCY
jgi:hypothetical protein